jgi:imidazolonepropionase-like amidohydrolase
MLRYGMDPIHAIVAGTSHAARLLRRDHLVGAIETGRLADLIVVEGNPLGDIEILQHRVRLVMKDGTIYRDELPAA